MGNEHKIRDGEGYTYSQGPWGFNLELDLQTPKLTHPFLVTLKGLKFKVYPGTVNSVMAKLDSTYLDNTPAPEKTISASGVVYLECSHTDGSAFPVTVDVKYNTSVPASTDSKLYIHIATINVASGKATKTAQVVKTSLWTERLKCGDDDAEYYVSQS